MISEEEIEKAIYDFNFFNEGDYITREMSRSKEIVKEYIEELEKRLCNHDEIISRLEEDNTRKDKIIDEIARFIEVNEFDATLLDEYCPDDYGNCRHPNDSEGCIKCIKEYFTKKASEK